MPVGLAAGVRRPQTFDEGFDTVEYLAPTSVDRKAALMGHLLTPSAIRHRAEA
jgi:hypothetical protein